MVKNWGFRRFSTCNNMGSILNDIERESNFMRLA